MMGRPLGLMLVLLLNSFLGVPAALIKSLAINWPDWWFSLWVFLSLFGLFFFKIPKHRESEGEAVRTNWIQLMVKAALSSSSDGWCSFYRGQQSSPKPIKAAEPGQWAVDQALRQDGCGVNCAPNALLMKMLSSGAGPDTTRAEAKTLHSPEIIGKDITAIS